MPFLQQQSSGAAPSRESRVNARHELCVWGQGWGSDARPGGRPRGPRVGDGVGDLCILV
jgi:hypothetical protein